MIVKSQIGQDLLVHKTLNKESSRGSVGRGESIGVVPRDQNGHIIFLSRSEEEIKQKQ